ncbi:MAG: peptide chain release factor 1, partial [Planctomycetes bacterium]|nr:peptide chain release factor 1 [Planctomycetota bacterium]
YEEIERLIQDPAVAAAPERYASLMKERGRLEKIVGRQRELDAVRKQKQDAEAMLADPEMRDMAREESGRLAARETRLASEIEEILLADDRESSRSVILEIRPGVGGDEAALFARELIEMYTRYAANRSWKVQILDVVHSDLGGLKYGNLSIEGEDVFKHLRYESGTHRVQRVPATEASGRVHTSTATVAVLPQAEDVDVEINPKDLQIDTYSAGGPGGQHVNKTQSAVRMTHLPTGIVVQCQNERSQIRNRELAMRWLRTRLFEHYQEKAAKERSEMRRSLIGTGDRSEKIRTYNFHDNRVTDHRIGFTLHRLPEILGGDLDELVAKLLEYERAEKLKKLAKR